VDVAGEHVEMRAGYGRLVWGRLDEIQPSDVINPLDVSRFILDGRSEARLPVAFARARLVASDRLSVEGILTPIFRRARFDLLDEPSSPFNLVADVELPPAVQVSASDVERRQPARVMANASGGGRVSATIGRVDIAAAVFRGFDGFGVIELEGQITPEGVVGRLVERFSRFTMVAADFETVAGEWALRGEVAAFVEKRLAGVTRPGVVDGRAFDGGFGFDRRSGAYRVFGSAVVHSEWSGEDRAVRKTDVNVVGSIDRQFRGDRYLARVFGVVNPADAFGFVRGLIVWRARDRVALEASAAAFLGTGDDTLARFKGRDFVLTRVRVDW
jgi:hypothetical protein